MKKNEWLKQACKASDISLYKEIKAEDSLDYDGYVEDWEEAFCDIDEDGNELGCEKVPGSECTLSDFYIRQLYMLRGEVRSMIGVWSQINTGLNPFIEMELKIREAITAYETIEA
jgi:hypothetical protein